MHLSHQSTTGCYRSLIQLTVRRVRKLARAALGGTATLAEAGLEAVGIPRPAPLLVLGHMRSGSTLLLHLLMTNPEISAVGERGKVYACRADLARLHIAARLAQGLPVRHLRYVADQVNHDHLTPVGRLLREAETRVLFLLREPEATIASIVELYRRYHPLPWSVPRAVDYYVQRLETLARLGAAPLGRMRAALIRYEDLAARPLETLEALRQFLQLAGGFSRTYRIHRFTRTYGDPGPNIATGRILSSTAYAAIDISEYEAERIRNAYAQCSVALEPFALSSLRG
jgi:hypothetical protein